MKAAFIDCTDDMLNKIAAKDPQMRDLIYIKKQPDLWSKLNEEDLVEPTNQFQVFIKGKYLEKKDNIEFCIRELKKSEK